jgi:HupE / UreJ protein
MRRFWLLFLAQAAYGHVVSMSTGDLAIEGARANFELRMPLYEISHVQAPERSLLEHVVFGGARMTSSSCRADSSRDVYICDAAYEFRSPPEQLDVECTLASITVPNHVHLLRVVMGAKRDQGVFDISFPRATLKFRPPTPAEVAFTEAGEGAIRALGGAAQILFLAALALAARSRRELFALGAMFVAGQAASVLVVPHTGWQPPPRFVEAAAALTVAYLAVEILTLPKAGARWLVAGVLGAFHGLYFHLFLVNSGYRPAFVLAGAAAADLALLSVLALAFSQLRRVVRGPRPVQVSAVALLVFGMFWFALRIRN